MKLKPPLFPIVALFLFSAGAEGAIIGRDFNEITRAGLDPGEVGYDVDADGLIDFSLSLSSFITTDEPSSLSLLLTTLSQRAGFAFLKTADPSSQLLALPGSAEIGPAPSIGGWETGSGGTST